jgi:uncharacterized membrane protein (DUF373 family)
MRSLRQASASFDSSATRLFRLITGWIVKLLVPVAIVALMLGVARVFVDLWHVVQAPDIRSGFDTIVTDILSTFVVIELMRSIVGYFEVHRLDLTFIIDAAVVFLLREVMIGVYGQAFDGGQLAGIAGLLLVVGAFRLAVVRATPRPMDQPPYGDSGSAEGPAGSWPQQA